jgi:hypothetical protein
MLMGASTLRTTADRLGMRYMPRMTPSSSTTSRAEAGGTKIRQHGPRRGRRVRWSYGPRAVGSLASAQGSMLGTVRGEGGVHRSQGVAGKNPSGRLKAAKSSIYSPICN